MAKARETTAAVDETATGAPAVKCPGWYHEMDAKACELDKAVHAWESNRRETTIGEREKRRTAKHAAAGQLQDPDALEQEE